MLLYVQEDIKLDIVKVVGMFAREQPINKYVDT